MKKIPTIALLEDALQTDLGWRRKELSSLYLSVVKANPSSEAQFRAIRAGIVLTYAHLEGFSRHAVKCYLQFVRSRGLAYSELATNFLALKISRIASQGTAKASYYHEAVNILTSQINDLANLPEPEIITANSNLTFSQFQEMLFCINVDSNAFSTKENFFDEVVLSRRNAIAHGEFRRPSIDDYLEIHNGVVKILGELQEALYRAASEERFKRSVLAPKSTH